MADHEPISEQRLAELTELAWSPVYEPPAGTPDRVRHDALRDAVREAERLRGRSRDNWSAARALHQILADHRVVMRVDGFGHTPKLFTDLMEWAAVTVEHETHRLRAVAARGRVDGPSARANTQGRCLICDGTTLVCRHCHQPRHDPISDHYPLMLPCRECNGGTYPTKTRSRKP